MYGTQVRNLENSVIETLQLEAAQVRMFSKIQEVRTAQDGIYCIPKVHNFAAVDALQQPSSLFQMTLMQKSTINAGGLARARHQLRDQDHARLYFVVPGRLFQQYKAVDASDVGSEQQWALRIPGFD